MGAFQILKHIFGDISDFQTLRGDISDFEKLKPTLKGSISDAETCREVFQSLKHVWGIADFETVSDSKTYIYGEVFQI